MKILEEYREEYTKNGKIAPAIGSQMDPNLKENIGIYMRELKRDSDTIKKLLLFFLTFIYLIFSKFLEMRKIYFSSSGNVLISFDI